MTHVTCMLTAKNRDQLGNRVRAAFLYTVLFGAFIALHFVVSVYLDT